jgi:hypothetical protein
MKDDKATDPSDISLLCTIAVVSKPGLMAQLVQKAWGLVHGRVRQLFMQSIYLTYEKAIAVVGASGYKVLTVLSVTNDAI